MNSIDIFTAAATGDIETTKALLSSGVDPNCVSDTGWNLLIYAVENDRNDMVEFLLDCGANVNFQSAGGWTALHQAVDLSIDGTIQTGGKQGDEPTDMIKYLLDRGANLSLKDNMGSSPLDIARTYNSKKIIKFFNEFTPK
ncbi:ankyrin repeat domain-containing protein [Paenibacillus anaericanus]|uniref:Ankyrin repeat domain-containing protein n=1 Tax=Paenibacillus anaericanus TaxID=170367 RepID=A0A3S1DQA3_9BACL|nr:ankyrin repeat domain-containing protein [Paenibacillus anaericanus]RUT46592.1 ankyrin repeat domain-containing protein [Paenibacillus anaericanus]